MEKKNFARSPEGIIARLANKIYISMGLTNATALKSVVLRYIANFNNDNQLRHYYTKVNLYNEITKDKMTFKVFMKLLRVLGIKHVTFTIKLTTATDQEVTVTEDISLANTFMTKGDDEVEADDVS